LIVQPTCSGSLVFYCSAHIVLPRSIFIRLTIRLVRRSTSPLSIFPGRAQFVKMNLLKNRNNTPITRGPSRPARADGLRRLSPDGISVGSHAQRARSRGSRFERRLSADAVQRIPATARLDGPGRCRGFSTAGRSSTRRRWDRPRKRPRAARWAAAYVAATICSTANRGGRFNLALTNGPEAEKGQPVAQSGRRLRPMPTPFMVRSPSSSHPFNPVPILILSWVASP
jgi:hypothetical protein